MKELVKPEKFVGFLGMFRKIFVISLLFWIRYREPEKGYDLFTFDFCQIKQ